MLEWIAVILLILFGLGFIIAEIIFVPGTTLLGLMGLLFTIIGIVISFISFGTGIGVSVLIISAVIGLSAIIYSFKTGVWKKFALNDTNKSKFNEGEKEELQVGEEVLLLLHCVQWGKGISKIKYMKLQPLAIS